MRTREEVIRGSAMDDEFSTTQSWQQHHYQQETPTSSSAGSDVKRKRPSKLTPSQRERKRAIDREAQRSIRTKTKNYIAHLESLVKVLEESDSNGPQREEFRTEQLAQQLRHNQDETLRLKGMVVDLQKLIRRPSAGTMFAAPFIAPESGSNSPLSISGTTEEGRLSSPTSFDHVRTQNLPRSVPTSFSPTRLPIPHRAATNISNAVLTTLYTAEIPEPPAPNPKYRRCEGEMFYYVEFLKNRAIKAGPEAISTNQAQDEDICVRALIRGWSETEDCHSLDVGWRALQQVDQIIFPHLGIIERIATLRAMRQRLIRQITSASASASAFPATEHSAIIDHFIWPGFRHLLYRDTAKYITTAMNESFRMGFRFLWNYQVAAAHAMDPITHMYTCTPEFVRRQLDLRCWTMKRAFLDLAPELLSAIPAYEASLARPISSPSHRDVGAGVYDADARYV